MGRVRKGSSRSTHMSTIATKKTENAGHDPDDELSGVLLTQRSELIGELAQAMANQFNNIMMAITGYAELELKKAARKDRRGLEQVLSHATRATSLIQKLLAFSRKHTSSPQPIALDTLITDVGPFLRELLGEPTELSLKLDAKCTICADRVEVEQALFALMLVARNAMGPDGTLVISTSLTDVDGELLGNNEEASPGKYVVLAVASSPLANNRRPANSRFDQSTQFSLSLAAARGILRDCGGFVRFSSEPRLGTSFKLYFPAFDQELLAEETPTLPRNPAVARTVLLVEDDDAVRVPAAEFLMMEGFKVLQARTGSEALGVVQQSRSSLDILVTDIFMPKMNGHEVAAALLKEHPDLKVLYISGDPGRQSVSGPAHMSINTTLRKPFRLNVLRDKVHDLLGE